MKLRSTLLVAGGGFAGAVSRYGIALALPESFPWGTLAVNVVGAFALGLFVYRVRDRGHVPDRVRLAASTGFVSSFTTYSTFAVETVALNPGLAAGNVLANYALGFAAVLAAREVIEWRS